MAKYLYEVRLDGGRSNSKFRQFCENIEKLHGKAPGYEGMQGVCIISHHKDADTVRNLCSDFNTTMKGDVTVEEITKETLKPNVGRHIVYTDIVEKYFLPHGNYPNIK